MTDYNALIALLEEKTSLHARTHAAHMNNWDLRRCSPEYMVAAAYLALREQVGRYEHCNNLLKHWQCDLMDSTFEVARLRAALKEFGRHRQFGQGEGDGCKSLYGEGHPHRGRCDCGLADAIGEAHAPNPT